MKQESPPALFEFFEGDSILSEGPLRHVCSRLTMPESSLPPELLDPDVPPFIVINVHVPVHPRAIFGARRLPPTVNAIFYLRMTKDTAEQLSKLRRGVEPASEVPGPIRLLQRWCRDAPDVSVHCPPSTPVIPIPSCSVHSPTF